MQTFHPTKQTGMTLLEVVVAMLIIGLGLAMSASMIQKSVRSAQSAENHNIAQALMQDIADKMRTNSLATPCYTDSPPVICQPDSSKKYKKPTYQRAKQDKNSWASAIKRHWGETATGSITHNTGNSYTITIKWEEVSDQSRQAEANKTTANSATSATMTFTL